MAATRESRGPRCGFEAATTTAVVKSPLLSAPSTSSRFQGGFAFDDEKRRSTALVSLGTAQQSSKRTFEVLGTRRDALEGSAEQVISSLSIFYFFFNSRTLSRLSLTLRTFLFSPLGPAGSNRGAIAFFFFPSSNEMLPAWASSSAPTPEPHQGFASSATVALVFFVLGVLVSAIEEKEERERASAVADTNKRW